MASFFQSAPFDSQQHHLECLKFTMTLAHNVQAVIPVGLPGFKQAYGVVIGSDAAQGFQQIVGYAWDMNGSNQPRITVQLASAAGGIQVELYVLYKV